MSTKPGQASYMFFDENIKQDVKLTWNYANYDQRRNRREDYTFNALQWTTSQPSTADDDMAIKAGIGNWVIVFDETAKAAQLMGYQYIVDKTPVDLNKAFKLLKKLQFIQMGRDKEASNDRHHGICAGHYSDTPIHNVRSIKARLLLLETKQIPDSKIKACIHKAIKMLACGLPVDRPRTDKDGNAYTERSVTQCMTTGCGQPGCATRRFERTKAKIKKDLNSVFEITKTNPDNRIVYVTFATNWPLPKDEERFSGNALHTERSLAKGQLKSNVTGLEEHTGELSNLLLHRTMLHKEHLLKTFASKPVRDVVTDVSIRKMETAWLQSSVAGRRCFPNPHTHAVLVVPSHLDNEHIQMVIEKKLKTVSQYSQVFVTNIDSDNAIEPISSYNAKSQTVTASNPDASAPQGTEVNVVLDERSLIELTLCEEVKSFSTYAASRNVRSSFIEDEDGDACVVSNEALTAGEPDSSPVISFVDSLKDNSVLIKFINSVSAVMVSVDCYHQATQLVVQHSNPRRLASSKLRASTAWKVDLKELPS